MLQKLRNDLHADKSNIEQQLSSLSRKGKGKTSSLESRSNSARSSDSTDYQTSQFAWTPSIKAQLKKVFGLDSFRLCQEGVINAALDDRDIVCVMPTGGGKSLTYQLPAIIGKKGLTVVISPLLALIWDQVRALKALKIECVVSDQTLTRLNLDVDRKHEHRGAEPSISSDGTGRQWGWQ